MIYRIFRSIPNIFLLKHFRVTLSVPIIGLSLKSSLDEFLSIEEFYSLLKFENGGKLEDLGFAFSLC